MDAELLRMLMRLSIFLISLFCFASAGVAYAEAPEYPCKPEVFTLIPFKNEILEVQKAMLFGLKFELKNEDEILIEEPTTQEPLKEPKTSDLTVRKPQLTKPFSDPLNATGGINRVNELYLYSGSEPIFHLSYLINKGTNYESPSLFVATADVGDKVFTGKATVERTDTATVVSAEHYLRPPVSFKVSDTGTSNGSVIYPMTTFAFGGAMDRMGALEQMSSALERPNMGFQKFFLRSEAGLGITDNVSFSSEHSIDLRYELTGGLETLFKNNGDVTPLPTGSFRFGINLD